MVLFQCGSRDGGRPLLTFSMHREPKMIHWRPLSFLPDRGDCAPVIPCQPNLVQSVPVRTIVTEFTYKQTGPRG